MTSSLFNVVLGGREIFPSTEAEGGFFHLQRRKGDFSIYRGDKEFLDII